MIIKSIVNNFFHAMLSCLTVAGNILLVASLFLLGSCTNTTSKSWFKYTDNTGTYSSPRLADLNRDNIPDIVIGAGGQEEKYNDTAVIALDGKTGNILWALPGNNQNVGSAVFQDINGDKVPDVFIGGRWAQFMAIDGASGNPIWSFYTNRSQPSGADGGWYNFTTPQFIPDQDGDSLDDLIVANGGDAKAAPGDTKRPAGRLLIISSATGRILANVVVPDGRETYMSVVCEKKKNDWLVYFGTGGETIGGKLYRTSLKEIMSGDIKDAYALSSDSIKGFVASPVLADINKDGTNDIIVNAVNGKMLAIDGATDSLLWEVRWPGTEAYTIPAAGYFTSDSIVDFFANFAIGTFPELKWSLRFMVNGKTGKIEYTDTIPAFQYASAIAADLNNDGFDEVLVNQSAVKRKQFENYFFSYLNVFDFRNGQQWSIGDTLPATNLASTPWIGDLDGDNKYDIIYNAVKYENAAFDLQRPIGMFTGRYATNISIRNPIRWGAFMGTGNDGIFR